MKKRIFLAINLPSSIKEKIFFFTELLKKKNRHLKIKWVEKENFHLTLHFLGYLEEKKIGELEKIIKDSLIKIQAESTKMVLGKIGAFPHLSSPRVIFLETKEKTKKIIYNLQKEIGERLKKFNFSVDERPWQAHITIGRNKSPGKLTLVKENLTGKEFEVKSIEIMESKLSSAGPRYKIIKSFNFF